MEKRKGAVEFAYGTLIGWIIGIVVLALLIFIVLILKGKGDGAIDFLKNLLRFGR